MCNSEKARLTTAEAAAAFGCEHTEALSLLRAAKISFTRMGNKGALLWDAAEVERLAETLRKPAAPASEGRP